MTLFVKYSAYASMKIPGAGLLKVSRTVVVIVDPVPPPGVHDVEQAVMVACVAPIDVLLRSTAVGLTVTAAVCVTPTPPAVAEMVLPSALVELKAVANTPLPSVVPDAGANAL